MDAGTPKEIKTESWISGISLLIFVGSMVLLLDDKFLFKEMANHDHLNPIAQVIHHRNDVRRRFDSDVIWLPVQKQDVVFENESLFTGDASGIEIKFDSDNTKISLNSRTLVKLTNTNKRNNLNVLHGRIKVTLGSKKNTTFKIAGKIYDFYAPASQTGQTSFQIEVPEDDKTQPKIEVTSGVLEISGAAEEKKIISENQVLEIATDDAPITPARSFASTTSSEVMSPNVSMSTTVDSEHTPSEKDQKKVVESSYERLEPFIQEDVSAPLPALRVLPAPSSKRDSAFSIFKVQTHFSNSVMSVTDVASGFSCDLLSKVNMGIGLSWIQKWSHFFESDVSMGLNRYEYEKPPTRDLNNSSITSSFASISALYRIFEHTKIGAC